MPKPLKVAMLASEMVPYAKTGGLADVAGALPQALAAEGAQVKVFIPRYASVKEKQETVKTSAGVTVHFIDEPRFFNRPGLYGDASGDYPDNLDRFSFFCRKSLSILQESGFAPDILHAHDWQTALGIVFRVKSGDFPSLSKTKTVFTVHNLAYQGIFPKDQYPKLSLSWDLFAMEGLEYYDKINLLKGGLVFSDHITTVSPTYAQEIKDPASGEGLDGVLRKRSKELSGILNGIDAAFWDPARDPLLPHKYSALKPGPKAKNKAALQKEFGLPVDPKAMMVGLVTRLASQKGLDLFLDALPLFPREIQWVILGKGDPPVEEALSRAAKEGRVALQLGFNEGLAHRIYAGADAFLMPSRYEPCGLGQMIAMRYGSVPIVRATGGLADTVFENAAGNGFRFAPYRKEDLAQAVARAHKTFGDKKAWQRIQKRGMTADFSWDRSAREYLNLYKRLLGAAG